MGSIGGGVQADCGNPRLDDSRVLPGRQMWGQSYPARKQIVLRFQSRVSNTARAAARATSAPTNCAPMNGGTSAGRIPENVFVSERAIVIAGLANEVDAVNQYAAPIQAATIHGASSERWRPITTSSRPKVATPSASHWAAPVRTCVESCQTGNSNMACAIQAPAQQPTICMTVYVACILPREMPPQGFDDGHSRIEVSATHRAKQCDEGSEHGYGRSSIRQERNAHVTAAKAFRHDPRTDYGGC